MGVFLEVKMSVSWNGTVWAVVITVGGRVAMGSYAGIRDGAELGLPGRTSIPFLCREWRLAN
jgi:hypothetical protein